MKESIKMEEEDRCDVKSVKIENFEEKSEIEINIRC